MLIMLISGCAFADIDLGEGYHVPEIFSSVLITNSDDTAIQNASVQSSKAGEGESEFIMRFRVK